MSGTSDNKFSDVIGALVASVAHARSVADVEALRIAYRYQRNELLKGLPVPRLRFRRVSISLPVILTGLIPGTPAETNPNYAIEAAASDAFAASVAELQATLSRARRLQNLTEDEQKRLERYQRLSDFIEREQFVTRFREPFARALRDALIDLAIHEGGTSPSDAAIKNTVGNAAAVTFKNLLNEATYLYIRYRIEEEGMPDNPFDSQRAQQDTKTLNEDEMIQDIGKRVRHAAEDACIAKPTVPPDFAVLVNTDNIKNAGGGPDAITRLSMVLTEEGLEWVTEHGRDGTDTTKLMPE